LADFTHLHLHTEYSLLDGAAQIGSVAVEASRLGMDALAITDHGSMYGVVDFYKACRKAGIKPILGCEFYVAPRGMGDRTPNLDDKPSHLVLLAENQEGYQNLLRLASLSFTEGFYYKPRVDREALTNNHLGLIALSGCLAGEVAARLLAGDAAKAREAAVFYRDLFGPENYYLELQDHGMPEQLKLNPLLASLGTELGIPLVATNDVHYIKREHAEIQDVLLCIQTGKTVDDASRMKFRSDQLFLRQPDEMAALMRAYPEALANTGRIAGRCDVELSFGTNILPDFPVPGGKEPQTYLRELCYEGLERRYGPEPSLEVRDRLEFELGVIEKMGFSAYFLIVWDFIHFARREGIPVGPGRGSAAGSVVAYTLGITNLDPLAYGLLFERFLNPERISMPDIDTDICYERRPEVINYVVNRYGADRVAQIITFGTMAARAAIRDVGRALSMPYSDVDKVAKLVPAELHMTIEKALETAPDLRQAYDQKPEVRKLIDTAAGLEGMPRHASTHAAGIVITKNPLTEYLPLYRSTDGAVTTQFPMTTVEELGLLKMDLLGLRTLTVIGDTVKILRESGGPAIDLEKVPLDDPATYEMLCRGDTTGVFQVESSGMRAILRDLKAGSFDDIVAINALYRPGPLGSGMVEDFIKYKHGKKKVTYLHPVLEPILRESYGVILYQEQVMQIASRMAGFSMAEADTLRKAMGKKKAELLAGFRARFIEGAVNNGVEEKIAGQVFDLMEFFAGYGFNKCLAGDTLVAGFDGRVRTIREIYETGDLGTVLTLDADFKLVKGEIAEVRENGVKDVFEIRTGTGRVIRATANHPFLAFEGWKPVEYCKIGERVAVTRVIRTQGAGSMPGHELAVLACVLSGGNTCHPGTFCYSEPAGPAYPDILWDEIISIEFAGREMTYDLTVDGTHNFVANDFVVHNSHAAAYALVIYQTAYLKANYPAHYMAALLTSVRDNTDKVAGYVEECRRMKIEVLPPDVNESRESFTVVGDKLRFGLAAVKNVGLAAVNEMLQVRSSGGPFRSLADFCQRVGTKVVNRRVLESLIKSGAFDSLGNHRAALMGAVDAAIALAGRVQRERQSGQLSLLDFFDGPPVELTLPDVGEFARETVLTLEKEALGLYISGHPLDDFRNELDQPGITRVADLAELSGGPVSLGGMISGVNKKISKRGQPFAVCTLEDLTGSVEVVFFAAAFEACRDLLTEEAVVVVRGKLSQDDDPKVLADQIAPLLRNYRADLRLTVDNLAVDQLAALKLLLERHPGPRAVYLYQAATDRLFLAGENLRVTVTAPLLKELRDVLGESSVELCHEAEDAPEAEGTEEAAAGEEPEGVPGEGLPYRCLLDL
jgi:DNA-directed DNA polymerase III PolC